MKLLLVFVLCGITCCLAGPTCSRDELAKCSEPPGPVGSEVEELDKVCRQVKCWLKIYDRCGIEIFGGKFFPIKGYHRNVNALCEKSSPLRRKYLENIDCIRSATVADKMKQIVTMCGIVFKPKEEFCKEIPKGFKCAVDYMTRKCGKDAGEVFEVAAYSYLDPYDCLSS